MTYHKSMPYNFKVTECPSSQASHFRIFSRPLIRYDLSVLIDFLGRIIYDTKKAFVTYSTFTLVNIHSTDSNMSCGYMPSPHFTLVRFYNMSFTFAFTLRNTYDGSVAPRFSIRPQPLAKIWGNKIPGNTDFLTINVPKSIMREAGLLTPNPKQMEWLYAAIGAWSKNFSKRNKYYTREGTFTLDQFNPTMLYSQLYHTNFQQMLKSKDYPEWGYCKDCWDLAPNIISPRAVNEDFLEYYCRYLAKDFYGIHGTRNVIFIENAAIDYLTPGILTALRVLQDDRFTAQDASTSRSFNTVMYLLNDEISLLNDAGSVSDIARRLLKGNI